MKRKTLTALIALSISAFGANFALADANNVEKLLKEKYPELPSATVESSKAPGLYQAKIENHVLYTNENADFLLVGGNVLTKDGSQTIKLSAPVEPATSEKEESTPSAPTATPVKNENTDTSYFGDSKLFSKLPFERAVKITYGNGGDKNKIYAIFEDPDCPYCQTLEKTFAENEDKLNMTAYLFYFPLNIHPGAKPKAEFLWCQKDQAGAWKSWMNYTASHPIDGSDQSLVEKRWEDWKKESGFNNTVENCDTTVIDKNYELGHALGFASTPMMIYKNSTRQPGLVTAEKMLGNFDVAERYPHVKQIESLELPEILKNK